MKRNRKFKVTTAMQWATSDVTVDMPEHTENSKIVEKQPTWCDGCVRHGKCPIEPWGVSICDE